MDVFEAIEKRRSYRGKYKPVPVPRGDLEKIMRAGLEAPSGCNKQTVRLIAVDDAETMKKLLGVIDPPVAETAPAATMMEAVDCCMAPALTATFVTATISGSAVVQ